MTKQEQARKRELERRIKQASLDAIKAKTNAIHKLLKDCKRDNH